MMFFVCRLITSSVLSERLRFQSVRLIAKFREHENGKKGERGLRGRVNDRFGAKEPNSGMDVDIFR